MIIIPARQRFLPQTIWWGLEFQPDDGVMTAPIQCDAFES
jgi:hypothetical protein